MSSEWPGPWVAVGVLLASIASSSSAHADTAVPRIPNLRAQRDPGSWVIDGRGGVVDVTATAPALDIGEARWSLTVTAHVPPEATAVHLSTSTEGVRLAGSVDSTRVGSVRGKFDVTAPTLCSVSQPTDPIEVHISYRIDGHLVDQREAVDDRCLLGRLVATPDGAAYAQLARDAMNDPSIRRAAHAVSEVRKGARAEIAELHRWLSGERVRYVADPYDSDTGWTPGHAYALEPTDTLRLGGDCEDWAILAAAFLAKRGVAVAIAETPNHVWVRAYEGADEIDVDLTEAPPQGAPEHVALVSPLSSSSSSAVALRAP